MEENEENKDLFDVVERISRENANRPLKQWWEYVKLYGASFTLDIFNLIISAFCFVLNLVVFPLFLIKAYIIWLHSDD